MNNKIAIGLGLIIFCAFLTQKHINRMKITARLSEVKVPVDEVVPIKKVIPKTEVVKKDKKCIINLSDALLAPFLTESPEILKTVDEFQFSETKVTQAVKLLNGTVVKYTLDTCMPRLEIEIYHLELNFRLKENLIEILEKPIFLKSVQDYIDFFFIQPLKEIHLDQESVAYPLPCERPFLCSMVWRENKVTLTQALDVTMISQGN